MSEREKLKPEEKVKNRNKIHSGRGKHKRSGSRGRCGSENTSKVGHAVRGRGRSGLPAGQAGAHIQSGIKVAGGTGVFVRKRKSGRAQQKVWITGQKAAPRLDQGV